MGQNQIKNNTTKDDEGVGTSNQRVDNKGLRKDEYAAAEAFVQQVYNATSPPYSQDQLEDWLATIRDLAPHVQKLNQEWLESVLKRLAHRNPEIHVRPRTQEEWQAIFPRYPTTDDGFVHSFDLDEHDMIYETLEKYGLVVVRAFSPEICNETIRAMFEEINALAKNNNPDSETIDPDQSWTWETKNWPSKRKFLTHRPALHQQAFANRTAPHIYKLFAFLWGEHKLRVSIDNWGATRGTRNLLIQNKAHQGTARLERTDPWGRGIQPHWDYNPWLWVDDKQVQGRNPGYQAVVALNNHRPGMGVHQTLPGGTAFLAQWTKERGCPATLNKKRASYQPAPNDPIRAYIQEIPLRQGEMIVWTWGQLHATGSNESDTMRLHQYIRMFPAREVDPFYEEHDRYAPQRILRQYLEQVEASGVLGSLEELGRRLIGLEQWPDVG